MKCYKPTGCLNIGLCKSMGSCGAINHEPPEPTGYRLLDPPPKCCGTCRHYEFSIEAEQGGLYIHIRCAKNMTPTRVSGARGLYHEEPYRHGFCDDEHWELADD